MLNFLSRQKASEEIKFHPNVVDIQISTSKEKKEEDLFAFITLLMLIKYHYIIICTINKQINQVQKFNENDAN